ncbi:probable cytochrome P450 9f2 [Drosophila pseudoobscura]|uniref:Probable cytochrome P450 9f2 n=1 Tax=Drosophila pseudoobscura pseudoobscura TaxID=46245 RepID=A0A6I8UMV7_DROPS|nr:probable cytochrome P450 9f2 [Drosophila pseudoobscura]
MLLEFVALLGIAFALFYRWATANNEFFKEKGIPFAKPKLYFGNMAQMFLRQKAMFDIVCDLYNKGGSNKVYGIFEQRQPLMMIRDPDLLRQITIKDFDHFINHRNLFGTGTDDDPHDMSNLFGSSLFSMRDARWKDMRSTLSPAFTGLKMRQMFQLMNQVAKEAVDCLKPDQQGSVQGTELDMKDYCTRFTNDVIASTAFGLQVNSFKERDNDFYSMGKKLTTFGFLQNLKFMLFFTLKSLNKYIKVDLFDKKSTEYFVRLVLDAMKYRQEHNIIRPDMINMLMEARGLFQTEKTKTTVIREWSDRDIVAQCFVFFFAGFETSAVLMCFTAQELMENEDVQQKLYEEVQQVDIDLDGKELSYEAIMGMKYLDQVVSEVLRKWPAAIAIDRECNKDITYELDGQTIEIKKGDYIWLPTCGFHRDPKYFENPNKFDPERFSEENKANIQPFTYYPFGLGQRNCIGSRFALLEAKAVIYYLLKDYRFAPAKKSCIPMELASNGFQLTPKSGFWVKFVPRN